MSKTVLLQIIQLSISTQFKCKYGLIVKNISISSHSVQSYNSVKHKHAVSSIWPIDRTLIRCYYSGPEWTWERWQWRGTPHSPKLQHCWNLTIRLFSAISRTLIGGGGLTPLQRSSRCILQPQPTGPINLLMYVYFPKMTKIRILTKKIAFLIHLLIKTGFSKKENKMDSHLSLS